MLSSKYIIEILDYMTDMISEHELIVYNFSILVDDKEPSVVLSFESEKKDDYGRPIEEYIIYPIHNKVDIPRSMLNVLNYNPNLLDDYGIRFAFNFDEALGYPIDEIIVKSQLQERIDNHLLSIAENSI